MQKERQDKFTQMAKEEYTAYFKQYGANPLGINNGAKDPEYRQDLRYKKMLSVTEYVKTQGNASILDVGCGYGGLFQYLQDNGYNFSYTGIDLCESMIEYASEQHKSAQFICGDFLEYEFENQYTYIICNLVLTRKFCESIVDMDEYARKFIDKMFSLCKVGMVYDVMKNQVDFMRDNLYYKSPVESLAYCMTLTDSFVIDSSYPLYEYMVYLFKRETVGYRG